MASLQVPANMLMKMECSHIMLLFFFVDGLDILEKTSFLEQQIPLSLDESIQKTFK